jgi:hypothetical protein
MQGQFTDFYETVVHHQASLGEKVVEIGTRGRCRYCGTIDGAKFKQVAHAVPEALGNRWIVSVDECDDCNANFSSCDAALAEALGVFLTLGGVPRKKGPVRKFGRTGSPKTLGHSKEMGTRRLSFRSINADDVLAVAAERDESILRMSIPMPDVAFIPARAYKAVAKMGFAFLPEGELNHFDAERNWLIDRSQPGRSRDHHVVASFGFIGNAPPIIVGRLFRRRDPHVPLPYMLFVVCVGSVCLQVALKADELDAKVPLDAVRRVFAQCTNILGKPDAPEFRIVYERPIVWDWASGKSSPQPVKSMILSFNQITRQGSWEPVFRSASVA